MFVRAFDIEWDTDGRSRKACGLPSESIVELDDDADVEYEIADALSDEYGYCVCGCDFEILSSDPTEQADS